MNGADAFIDTSVLLYLLSDDSAKAERAEDLLTGKSAISVQVLNECAAVALRNRVLSIHETREFLESLRSLCVTHPFTVEGHERGLEIAERYGFSLYDSMIVASALEAKCRTLYSEDLQDGQLIEKQLRIVDPFSV